MDEIIFRTTNVRNRLILELMDRGGMRIGEVLKLRFCDIQNRKLIIKDPKSGKEQKVVFIPQKVADRLWGDQAKLRLPFKLKLAIVRSQNSSWN